MSHKQDLHFHSEHDIILYVEKLRDGCTTGGKWTLEQTAWHLALPLKTCLHPPQRTEPNADEKKMQAYLDDLFAVGVMADGLDAPEGTEPPAQVGPEALDEFVAGLHEMSVYPHALAEFGPFGPVTIAQLRDFVRIHSAHHLKLFRPTSDLRHLEFETEDDVIAEVERLRKGCKQLGNWTLPQICYHVAMPMQFTPPEPADLQRSEEQEAMKAGFVDYILTERKMKPEWKADGPWIPPEDAGEADVDAFLGALRTQRDYPHGRVMMGPIGPVDIDEFRGVNLAHAAHHLSRLVPTAAAD